MLLKHGLPKEEHFCSTFHPKAPCKARGKVAFIFPVSQQLIHFWLNDAEHRREGRRFIFLCFHLGTPLPVRRWPRWGGLCHTLLVLPGCGRCCNGSASPAVTLCPGGTAASQGTGTGTGIHGGLHALLSTALQTTGRRTSIK